MKEATNTEKQKTSAPTQARRRRKSRSSEACAGDAEIELELPEGGTQVLTGRIVDLTEFGVGIDTPTALNVGAPVTIASQFFAAGTSPRVKRRARVIHCRLQPDGLYRNGFGFEEQDSAGDPKTASAATVNGSLPDYYEVLQISASADTEMIQRVFRLLAQRYHPDNNESGNDEIFRSVLQAYRVLSDPEQRAAYDAKYKTARSERLKIFEQQEPADYALEKDVRAKILRELYEARKKHPDKPSVSLRELEEALACSRERLEFNLWYLRGKAQAAPTDTGSYVITPEGVDAAESGRRENYRPVTPLLEGPRAVS
jgi:DnaJ domain